MFSKSLTVFLLAGVAASVISNPSAQMLPSRGSVRFYPDVPLRRDDDMRSIAEPANTTSPRATSSLPTPLPTLPGPSGRRST